MKSVEPPTIRYFTCRQRVQDWFLHALVRAARSLLRGDVATDSRLETQLMAWQRLRDPAAPDILDLNDREAAVALLLRRGGVMIERDPPDSKIPADL